MLEINARIFFVNARAYALEYSNLTTEIFDKESEAIEEAGIDADVARIEMLAEVMEKMNAGEKSNEKQALLLKSFQSGEITAAQYGEQTVANMSDTAEILGVD